MRVLTWNIRTGGGSRLVGIRAVLARERPDLLALQELRGWDRASLRQLADELGMAGHLAGSVFGQPVAVLVRPPLRILRRDAVRWRLHHAAAAVTVGPLTFVSTHLNPVAPYRRYREATWLAARYHSRPVLLAGDLNSIHPSDNPDLSNLPDRYRRRHLRPPAGDSSPLPSGDNSDLSDSRAESMIDTRALRAFEAGGLRDLWQTAGRGPDPDPRGPPAADGQTVPTTSGGGAEFAPMRLDYLLGSPGVVAAEMRVVRGDETEWASDHYPLRADLDL